MKVMFVDSAADPVRLAFLHLWSKRDGFKDPKTGKVSEPKFEATPIFAPNGPNAKKMQAAITQVAKEKFGEKSTKVFDAEGDPVTDDNGEQLMLPAWEAILRSMVDDQKGLRKGNLKKTASGDTYDGFENMVYVNPKNATRPGIFDRDATPLAQEDGRPYSGCYGNVEIDVWALNKPNVTKRIVCDLLGVQFTRDGDAFGGGSAPSKADSFASLSAADDEPSTGSAFD